MLEKTKKNQQAPYGFEIAMLKAGKFDPDLLEKFRHNNEKAHALF